MQRVSRLRVVAYSLVPLLLGSCIGWNSVSAVDDLGQGWSQSERDLWYEQTQGSRLLPYWWAMALETGNGTGRFFSPENLARYGYLLPEATSKSKLSIGFAIDQQKDDGFVNTALRWYQGQSNKEPWIGLNCAACHTAEIDVDGKRVRVDGGPTIADFQTMIEDLDNALRATREDPAKFERFARLALREDKSPAVDAALGQSNRNLLKDALAKLITWEEAVALANHGGEAIAPDPRYGAARLDAFGHIFNKVALFTKAERQTFNPSTAPVSYPFLWNVSQTDRVQWNGMVWNQTLPGPGKAFDYGALGRNAGEVTGVFGDIALRPSAGLGGYRSSVQVQRLSELERLLARLRPPAWPLSEIDMKPGSKWARGKDVYVAHCKSCHQPLDRTDLKTRFESKVHLFRAGVPDNVPPGTDPWMACNAYTYQIRTGVLKGTPGSLLSGAPLGEIEPTSKVLETVVKGELANQKGQLIAAAIKAIFNSAPSPRPDLPGGFVEPGSERASRLALCMKAESDVLGYKARPLTGIWATAPYLHNGSVPTLYDLLLPPEKRPRSFYLGTRKFDTKAVGYQTQQSPENWFRFRTHDDANKPIPGNDNAGHDYGNAKIEEPDRWALIEYLKSL